MTPPSSIIPVWVNDQRIEIPNGQTLTALLCQLDMPMPATAVAMNDTIIPRSEWETTRLTAGDRIALFQAIAGG